MCLFKYFKKMKNNQKKGAGYHDARLRVFGYLFILLYNIFSPLLYNIFSPLLFSNSIGFLQYIQRRLVECLLPVRGARPRSRGGSQALFSKVLYIVSFK